MTRAMGTLLVVWNLCNWLAPDLLQAQGFGGFGGAGSAPPQSGQADGAWQPSRDLPLLPPEDALYVITVDGTADIRVAPEGIRVVLAATSEADTAEGCQEKNAAQVKAVRNAWAELKIPQEQIVEDFINILPRYEWRLIDRDNQQFRIQQRQGYRMQTNLHVSVATESEAMAAIRLAFQHGVSEIVTFDYWNSKLDEHKVKARAAAAEAAKEKSKTLLAVFDNPPKVINVQERTEVVLPHALYQTYQNVLEEEVQYNSSWNNLPAIKAYRPKMTFLQALQSPSDVRPRGPAMRPEIAVVSTVRLYYQSPADKTVPARSH